MTRPNWTSGQVSNWGIDNVGVDPGGFARSGVTYYTVPGFYGSTRGTSGWAASTYYVPIQCEDRSTFDEAYFGVTTTGTATIVRLGIYNSDVTNQPTGLVADLGTVSVTTTGSKTISISPGLVLERGRYLICWAPDGTVTSNIVIGACQSYWADFGNNSQAAIISASVNNSGSLPSPGSAWTNFSPENRGFFLPVGLRRTS